MPPQKLDRAHWQTFCDRMSQGLARQRTDIEITAPEQGLSPTARWLPATGLTYDAYHDLIDFAVEDLGHRTLRLHELYVDMSTRGLECLCILDQSGQWQVVLLRDPLMLSTPAATD